MNIALSRNSYAPHVGVISGLFFALLFLIVPVQTNAQVTNVSLNVATLITLTNADRTAHGVASLAESALLDAAAQKKANDMVTKNYFAHYSPEGISPWSWFTSVGYYYTHAGENLAINFSDSASLEAAWSASASHQANIVRSLYTQTGIGIAHGTYLGKPTTFVVQFFATPDDALTKTTITTSALATTL